MQEPVECGQRLTRRCCRRLDPLGLGSNDDQRFHLSGLLLLQITRKDVEQIVCRVRVASTQQQRRFSWWPLTWAVEVATLLALHESTRFTS